MSETRPRRWKLYLFSAMALAAVVLAIAEIVLRTIVPNIVADHVRESVNLSEDHPVDVQLTGYLTPQVIFGNFSEVHLGADDVPIAEGIRASISGVAHDVPFDISEHELGDTQLTAQFTQEQLTQVLREFSRGMGQDIEIEGDRLAVSHELSLFGQGIPITVSFFPSVIDHKLHIEPISVDAAGILSVTVDELENYQLLAPLADGLDLCVAEYLPAGIHLDRIALSTTNTLSVTVNVEPRIGMDPSLQQLGTCD